MKFFENIKDSVVLTKYVSSLLNFFQNYTYSLIDQAENAVLLWKQLGIKRAHLVSHDMGDSVLTEVLALRKKSMLGGQLNPDFFEVITAYAF